MKEKLFVTPEFVTPMEIKEIRKQLELTQKEFAALIHTSKSTIERWEAGRETINGPIVTLLQLLERHPEYVE